MARFSCFLFVFLAVSFGTQAQLSSTDLPWLVYEEGKYVAVDHHVSDVIYFRVESSQAANASLEIIADEQFFVFLNGKILQEASASIVVNVDSLSRSYPQGMLFAIFQKNLNPRAVHVRLLGKKRSAGTVDVLAKKPDTYFKDFVVFAGIILMAIFAGIITFNPKLASDYFSVTKIFSLREVDDSQSNARLTSSANIQFYLASSLLIGYFLMIILSNLPANYSLPLSFTAKSFSSTLLQWLRLSLIVVLVLGIKIVLVFNLTRLFDMRALARIHFFNWIRLMLVVAGVCSVLAFVYYVNRGQELSIFSGFLMVATSLMLAWIAVVFMKLNGKTEHSMFHLFSYICATEIIPLVITVKVLFQ